MSATSIALNRFGLGTRPDQPLPEEPHRWLIAQSARFDTRPAPLAAPEDRAEARERLRRSRDEIAALPDTDRRICELCLLEGHSYAEAAEMLGLSVGAVTQRVSRNRRRLKKVVMHDEH